MQKLDVLLIWLGKSVGKWSKYVVLLFKLGDRFCFFFALFCKVVQMSSLQMSIFGKLGGNRDPEVSTGDMSVEADEQKSALVAAFSSTSG